MLDERAPAPAAIDLTDTGKGRALQVPCEPVDDVETGAAGRHVHPTPPDLAVSNPPWRWVVTAPDGSWRADGWTLTRAGARWAAFRAEHLHLHAAGSWPFVARASTWVDGLRRRPGRADDARTHEEPRAA